jgi:hypothetical protein
VNLSDLRPTPAQDMLLRAVLHPDPEAAGRARDAWTRRVDLDTLDAGSLHLLPLLTARGDRAGLHDDALARSIRNVVRFSWLRTQMLARQVAPAIAALREAGLEPTLAKGAALVHAHGIDPRLRPMFDIDVFVSAAHLERAVEVLRGAGFRTEHELMLIHHGRELVRDNHAWGFMAPGGAEIDLHWHLLHTARNEALDARLCRGAVPASIGGEACRALAPEGTLVVSIAHGTRRSQRQGVRWAGDAALLLRAHGATLDWDAIVRHARDARLGRPVAAALDYVAEIAGLRVPPEARAALGRRPVPLALRLPAPRNPIPGRARTLVEAYEEDASSNGAPGKRTGPAAVAGFLGRRWGIPARKTVLWAPWVAAGRPWAVRRAVRRIAGAPARRSGAPLYTPGTHLDFGTTAAGVPFLRQGWWYPEGHGIWTRASAAGIVLGLAEPLAPGAELVLTVTPAASQRRPAPMLEIIVNDVPLAQVRVHGPTGRMTSLRVLVPQQAVAGWRRAEITLVVDRPLAPADLGLTSDLRQLGVALASLQLG